MTINTVGAARMQLQRAGSNTWLAAGPNAQPYIIPQWQADAIAADLRADGYSIEIARAAVEAEFRIYHQARQR